MRVSVSCVTLALLCGALATRAPCQTDDGLADAVATVGSSTISIEHFRSRYVDHLLKTGLHDAPLLRSSFLNGLIAKRLLVLQAEEQGLTSRRDFRAEREAVSKKLLIDAYARHAIYERVSVTGREVEEMFVRVNTQLTARHLYAPTLPRADALLHRLEMGETFEDLAAETFRDSTLAANGGLIGPFSFDEMDPAFEDAAFELAVGEVSQPVKTAAGYSIIQLLDRFEKPILTETEFAQRRERLEAYVRHRKQRAATTAFVEALAVDLLIRFEEPAIENLLARITGLRLESGEEDLDSWLEQPLLTFRESGQDRVWTIGQFREQASSTPDAQRSRVTSRQDLLDYAGGLVAREVMVERALSLGLDRSKDFERAIEETMEDWSYAVILETLRRNVPPQFEDADSYVRAHVLGLRSDFPVVVHREVLNQVKLIRNASS